MAITRQQPKEKIMQTQIRNISKLIQETNQKSPSATESEILPLHKPAVYTKGFVLRRPSGGSQ